MGACASKFSVSREVKLQLQVDKDESIKKSDEVLTSTVDGESKRQSLGHLLEEVKNKNGLAALSMHSEGDKGLAEKNENSSEEVKKATAEPEANPPVNESSLDPDADETELAEEEKAQDVKSEACSQNVKAIPKASQKRIDEKPVENAKQHETAEELVGILEAEKPREYDGSTPDEKSVSHQKPALLETQNIEVDYNKALVSESAGKKGMETQTENEGRPPQLDALEKQPEMEKSEQQIKPASEVDKKKPDQEEYKPVETTCVTERAQDEYDVESLKTETSAERKSNGKPETQEMT